MSVQYRTVAFTPGYRVGSDGTVWTRRNGRWGLRREWRKLRPATDAVGYRSVAIMMPNKRPRSGRINVLVLLAFRGPRPRRHDSCHGNGKPRDNRLGNLRWGTRRENMLDASAHGRLGKRRAT